MLFQACLVTLVAFRTSRSLDRCDLPSLRRMHIETPLRQRRLWRENHCLDGFSSVSAGDEFVCDRGSSAGRGPQGQRRAASWRSRGTLTATGRLATRGSRRAALLSHFRGTDACFSYASPNSGEPAVFLEPGDVGSSARRHRPDFSLPRGGVSTLRAAFSYGRHWLLLSCESRPCASPGVIPLSGQVSVERYGLCYSHQCRSGRFLSGGLLAVLAHLSQQTSSSERIAMLLSLGRSRLALRFGFFK